MYNENPFIRQGWQCPVCGRVYSPDTSMCYYCGNDQKTNFSTTTDTPLPNDLFESISNTDVDAICPCIRCENLGPDCLAEGCGEYTSWAKSRGVK